MGDEYDNSKHIFLKCELSYGFDLIRISLIFVRLTNETHFVMSLFNVSNDILIFKNNFVAEIFLCFLCIKLIFLSVVSQCIGLIFFWSNLLVK